MDTPDSQDQPGSPDETPDSPAVEEAISVSHPQHAPEPEPVYPEREATPGPEIDAADVAAENAAREPLVHRDGERVRFSLNTVTLAVAIVSLAMVVLASFFIGRQVGAAQARRSLTGIDHPGIDQLSAVRTDVPQPGVVEDLELVSRELLTSDRQEQSVEQASVDGWIRGLNYIWIDTFSSLEDAERARRYLDEAGVEATSVPVRGTARFRLITNRGFSYPEDKASCQALEATIRQLGEGYLGKGGRYKFDCQVTKLTKSHW